MTLNTVDSYVIRLQADESRLLLLAGLLDDWNLCVHLPDEDFTGQGALDVYCETAADAEEKSDFLRTLCRERLPVGEWAMSHFTIAREEWADNWKRFFKTERVSERIVVKPTWESFAAEGETVVIELDPGMSFGTGRHGTTQACLQLIDLWQRRQLAGAMLDIGCGSGILAIAAARLGFAPVEAFDYDPDSVRIAKENLALNRIGSGVRFWVDDVKTFVPAHSYALVAANLLAGLLLENADRIAACVAPGGGLVLSGILTSQYADVRTRFEGLGFRQLDARAIAEWTTGCFTGAAEATSEPQPNEGR